jgi:hypothetical protein
VIAARAKDSAVSAAGYTYMMCKTGPDVNPEEVELLNVAAVEVMVLWGQNVLHVAHLKAGEGFTLGEEQSKEQSCDFFIPEEKLGTTRLPIVTADATGACLTLPASATGRLERKGQETLSFEALRNQTDLVTATFDGHRMQLRRGMTAIVQIADFVIRVSAVNAGKPSKKGLAAGVEWDVFSYFGASFVGVGAMVAAMAFFMPSLADAEDADINQDQLYLMQQYLVSAAEREQEVKPTEAAADEHADDHEGGTGSRAKHEEGSMGKSTARATNRHFAVAGPRDNPDPHIAREAALYEATHGGMIGLLNSGIAGDPKAPTAPWGRDESLGTDEVSAQGNMWGDTLGDAYGAGGFGLSGIGDGGGGRGLGIGLGDIGALGHGAGLGSGQGIGVGHGHLGPGKHRPRTPTVRVGTSVVSGHLPPEVIQRIVRQNYGRFRMCYEQGLTRNPNLEGRVQVRFVINREGSVSNVQNGGSDLPDSGVTSCVISAYYGLSFPQPEGGIVTVTYPIMFQPG